MFQPRQSCPHALLMLVAVVLGLAVQGCHGGRLSAAQELTASPVDVFTPQRHTHEQHQQQRGTAASQQHHWQQLTAAVKAGLALSSTSSSSSSRRTLLQFRPSQDEQHSKHSAKLSGWHAASVTLLCLLSMGVLGFMGYKAMQWYERTRRPGYVELQTLDAPFFRPTFTL